MLSQTQQLLTGFVDPMGRILATRLLDGPARWDRRSDRLHLTSRHGPVPRCRDRLGQALDDDLESAEVVPGGKPEDDLQVGCGQDQKPDIAIVPGSWEWPGFTLRSGELRKTFFAPGLAP